MFPWFIWKRSKISRWFQKPLNTLNVCTFCSHAYFFEGRLRSLLLHDFWIHADFWMHYSWFLKPILQLRTTTRMNNQESLTPLGSSWAAVLTMPFCSNWKLTTWDYFPMMCVAPILSYHGNETIVDLARWNFYETVYLMWSFFTIWFHWDYDYWVSMSTYTQSKNCMYVGTGLL